jgi:radical SAM superfamily enzyme YgiQ (UPF0313 family)
LRILLVVPSRAYANVPGFTKFPDELLSIAGVLEAHGHEVRIHDQNLDKRQAKDFMDFKPQMVGYSVATGPNIADARQMSTEFKELLPDLVNVWGFRHPSSYPKEVLAEPYVDYVIVGQGEYAIAELAGNLEEGKPKLADIGGLAYEENGQVHINPERPLPMDLDDLPDPAWHLIDLKKYPDVTLNTSRGCPHRCTFCCDYTFFKGTMTDLSAARIVDQMEKLHTRYGVEHIFISGERFALNRERLREFCELMQHKKLKVKWNCPVSGALDKEDVELMARGGCTSVLFEIESGSQRMLDFLNKGNVEEMSKTFWYLARKRIIPTIFMYYDIPTETVEDFQASLDILKKLDNPPFLYMKFVPYPDTELFNYCIEHGIFEMPKTLDDWVTFPLKCATEWTLSEVPRKMMDEAMASYRKTYVTHRVRFMAKYNPRFFLTIFSNPPEFFKAMRSLASYYLNILFDVANGPESGLAKLFRKLGGKGSVQLPG